MSWRSKSKLALANRRDSSIFCSQGKLEDLGAYLCFDEEPAQFVISGGTQPNDRYEPLYAFFDAFIGRFPMMILHNQDIHIEAMAEQAWRASEACGQSPLWTLKPHSGGFEPFYGMNGQQVAAVVRQLVKKLGYAVSPRLDRVVRAHMELLAQLDIPVSLSGFRYLCQFEDMEQFHDAVLSLPCGEAAGRRLWADLGADHEEGGSQMELFRTVISNLARDAAQSGWRDDGCVDSLNCLEAIRRGGTLLLPVNDLSAELLLPYLVEEWRESERTPFILLLDGVRVQDERMLDYLLNPNSGCRCGIVSENAAAAFPRGEEDFLRFAGRIDTFLLFKHGAARSAAVLSEIMGRSEQIKLESSVGVTLGLSQFLSVDGHRDVQFSTENRYRVMPEEITGLGNGQAVVFDAVEDEIIYFN